MKNKTTIKALTILTIFTVIAAVNAFGFSTNASQVKEAGKVLNSQRTEVLELLNESSP